MSRTTRRKNMKRRWYNFDTEEHFNVIKELKGAGNPYPEQCRGWTGWMPQAPQALRDHREAEWFHINSRQQPTFQKFVAHEDAMFHSDRGWHHHGPVWRGAGGHFNGEDRNISFERPHRRAVKQFIHRCVVDDVWDDSVVPEYKSRGWWMYYD